MTFLYPFLAYKLSYPAHGSGNCTQSLVGCWWVAQKEQDHPDTVLVSPLRGQPHSWLTVALTVRPKVWENRKLSRIWEYLTTSLCVCILGTEEGIFSVSSCGKVLGKEILLLSPLMPLSTHPSGKERKLLVLYGRTWNMHLLVQLLGSHSLSQCLGTGSGVLR